MACLRKFKSSSDYFYDITVNGQRIIRSTKTSDKSRAKKILDKIRGDIATRKFDLEDYSTNHVKLQDFFEDYFVRATSRKRRTTIINEKQYAKAFTDYMRNCNLDAVNELAVQKWMTFMLNREKKTGGKLSKVTINIQRRFLKAAFNEALEQKYIRQNPFKGIKELRVDEKRLFLRDREMREIFRCIDEDIEKAKSAFRKRALWRFKIFVEFLLNTGLRRQEALDLRWENIDEENGNISVEHTKTGTTRVIPLNTDARRCIEEVGEELFCSFKARYVSGEFQKYLERANITGMKLHSLRHTFATNLVRKRKSIAAIQKLLGHLNMQTTLKYAKVEDEEMRDAVESLCNEETEDGKVLESSPLYRKVV